MSMAGICANKQQFKQQDIRMHITPDVSEKLIMIKRSFTKKNAAVGCV
jgi:hypothetical protein